MPWPADSNDAAASGGFIQNIRTANVSGPVLLDDGTILVDTSAGNVVLTLPAASPSKGRRYTFKKVSSDANSFTVSGNVDGDATGVTVMAQYEAVAVNSNGTVYFVLYRG